MRVIINASPLIFLCKSGFQDLLPQLHEEIIVPTPVWEEVMAAGRADMAAQIFRFITTWQFMRLICKPYVIIVSNKNTSAITN